VNIVVTDENSTASLSYEFAGNAGGAGSPARLVASVETWRLLLAGRVNLVTLLRRGELTWSEGPGRQWTRSELLQATGWLLGIAAGPDPQPVGPGDSEHPVEA
jgi:hypothetical protein